MRNFLKVEVGIKPCFGLDEVTTLLFLPESYNIAVLKAASNPLFTVHRIDKVDYDKKVDYSESEERLPLYTHPNWPGIDRLQDNRTLTRFTTREEAEAFIATADRLFGVEGLEVKELILQDRLYAKGGKLVVSPNTYGVRHSILEDWVTAVIAYNSFDKEGYSGGSEVQNAIDVFVRNREYRPTLHDCLCRLLWGMDMEKHRITSIRKIIAKLGIRLKDAKEMHDMYRAIEQ